MANRCLVKSYFVSFVSTNLILCLLINFAKEIFYWNMDLSPEEVVASLLSKEAEEKPSDDVKPEDIIMELPEWFDEKKYNQGREFYSYNSYAIFTSLIFGTVAVFSVPSILRVLVSTKRSSSSYTAYRRYFSTSLHFLAWFDNELKPGSKSWKSLYSVRKGHARNSRITKNRGIGIICKRDVALTLCYANCFAMLKPDFFGITQLRENDWEAYNHYWSVIGHMLGLEDRYNVCRKTVDETREICQILLDRVITPFLTNPPEHFEYMARVMIDGMWSIMSSMDEDAILFWCKHLANVPGYIYTENERIELQNQLKRHLKGKSLYVGVESSSLIQKPAIDVVDAQPSRLLHYRDYETVHMSPEYRKLGYISKFKLISMKVFLILCSFTIGRIFFNMYLKLIVNVFTYFPIVAFFRFGIKESFVNIFEPGPTDNAKPKLNFEYNKL